MAFFGMYPSKYIGGNPYILGGGGFYGGAHPSSISTGLNYYTGAMKGVGLPAQTVPSNFQGTGQIQNQDAFNQQAMPLNAQTLQNALNEAKSKQGAIGKAWDGIKGATGLGLSSKKCQGYINDVQSGKMTFEEAYNKVHQYQYKQTGAVNIITGLAAGATALVFGAKGQTAAKSILSAMGIGAGVKAGLKTFDRGTNNVQNDALDPAQILKDGASGAVYGGVSASALMAAKKIKGGNFNFKGPQNGGTPNSGGPNGPAGPGTPSGAVALLPGTAGGTTPPVTGSGATGVPSGAQALSSGSTGGAGIPSVNPTGAGAPVIYLGDNSGAGIVSPAANLSGKGVPSSKPLALPEHSELLGLPAQKDMGAELKLTPALLRTSPQIESYTPNFILKPQTSGVITPGTPGVQSLPPAKPLALPSSERLALPPAVGTPQKQSLFGTIKENLSRMLHGAKNPKAKQSAQGEILKGNTARTVHDAKSRKSAVISALFGGGQE